MLLDLALPNKISGYANAGSNTSQGSIQSLDALSTVRDKKQDIQLAKEVFFSYIFHTLEEKSSHRKIVYYFLFLVYTYSSCRLEPPQNSILPTSNFQNIGQKFLCGETPRLSETNNCPTKLFTNLGTKKPFN